MLEVTITKLVKVHYKFPDVSEQDRNRIYKVLCDPNLVVNHTAWGDGFTNEGVFYIYEDQIAYLKDQFEKLNIENTQITLN
tara:strand:- start:231 stop:473 length:243 start_codon:yes stop_codon:yes gene_type:complete